MRKSILLLILSLTAALALFGCGTGELAVVSTSNNSITIQGESADTDKTSVSHLTVSEGEQIVVEPEIEGDGQVQLDFYPSDESDADDASNEDDEDDEDIDDAFDDDSEDKPEGDPAVSLVVEGSETSTENAAAGNYEVYISILKEMTGTVTVRCETLAGMPNPWHDVSSAKEAGKKAGVGTFVIPEGQEISLGVIQPESYRYMENLAEANIPIAAVEMTLRKGTSTVADVGKGDISGDYTEYSHTWSQDVDGQEVTCFGNREGEATKTIWVNGDYCFAILAYGGGGDDDYGLSEDDVAILVKGMQ